MLRRTLLFLFALTGTVLVAPRASRAQTKDDIARADALFNAGKALTDAGQFADACAKFAESKRLAPGLGVTLYLADCYEHMGRTASAWTQFRSAEGQARERNDKRADVARARAQALEAKLNRITITVAPTIPRAGLSVLRDGLPVEQEELGLAVPVDPGDHVVVVAAPGHATRTLRAHVGPESPAATVNVDTLEDGPPAAGAATPAAGAATPAPAGTPAPAETSGATSGPSGASAELPGEPPTSEDRGATRRWIGISVGAAGLVAAGVGTVFGLSAKSKLDASNDGHCNAADYCYAEGLSMRKDAENAATLSTILFVAGGAALAAGVVLYVTAPKHPSAAGLVVAPAPVAGGGGALVRATF
jgi:hypothetical protein